MNYKLSNKQLRELAESAYEIVFDTVAATQKLAGSARHETADMRRMTEKASMAAAELSAMLAAICELAKKQGQSPA